MLAPKFVEFPPKKLKFYQNKIKNASHTPPKREEKSYFWLHLLVYICIYQRSSVGPKSKHSGICYKDEITQEEQPFEKFLELTTHALETRT